jgi:hypothetical protein
LALIGADKKEGACSNALRLFSRPRLLLLLLLLLLPPVRTVECFAVSSPMSVHR